MNQHISETEENTQDAIQPDHQEAANKIYEYAANLMVHHGKDSIDTKEALMQQGLSSDAAQVVVDNLETQIQDAKKARAKKDMLYGALWCVGGLVVTFVTMSAASNGGSYVVTWGAIIFGGYQFFKGLINYN